MKFEFGKYTEVTKLAHKVNPEYAKFKYTRVFICLDTWDYWLCRILENTNEDYETEEGSFILERDKISKFEKKSGLDINIAKKILIHDGFENWDFKQSHDINELIDMIDGGFGINSEEE